MTFTLPTGGQGREFQSLEAGSHVAVCNLLVDLGLQPGSAMYPQPRRLFYLRFEVPAERLKYEKDGVEVEGPMTIGKSLTASMNEKATLRHWLEGWRGKSFTDAEAAAFDISAVLSKACMLTCAEKTGSVSGKTRVEIVSIGKLPKGMPAPAPENEPIFYTPDDPNPHTFNKLPKWIQEKLANRIIDKPKAPTEEQADDALADQASGGMDDDDMDSIPF